MTRLSDRPILPHGIPARFTRTRMAVLLADGLCVGMALTSVTAFAQGSQPVSTLGVIVVEGTANGLPAPHPGGQVARGGSLGILGTSDTMDAPFSTTNFTSSLIQDQQARSVADVVVNDASVRALTASGGFGDEFQVRGFTVSNADIGINGLYGLAPTTRLPVEMVERVEVLKGPGTLANGVGPNGSIGGTINLVTKRAQAEPITRLTTTYLSRQQVGAHLDVGRRFGQDKRWGARVNGVVRGGEGNVDGGDQKLGLATLGLDYEGTRMRWSLDAFTQRDKVDEFRPQTGFAAGITRLPDPPDARLNFYPGTELDSRNSTVTSHLEYDINDNLTAYASAGHTDLAYDQIFPSARPNALGRFDVRNGYYDYESETVVGNVGLRARFATGGIRHAVTFSASRMNQESGYFYATSATTAASSLYDPSPLPGIATPRGEPVKSSELTLSSLAVADTMSFADDRVLLTLGLRDQTIELENFSQATGASTARYRENAVSPLVGVVFKPIDSVSLYGNYTAGLTRGATAPATAANAGETFAPYKSKQYETGIKVDWGTLTTQASVYQISRPNSLTDPITNIFSFEGEQRNRGLELSAYGEVRPGLRMMASAAFNDAKLTRTAGGIDQGNDAVGIPERVFTVGVDWDTPWVSGLSLNGRVINTSSVYYNTANTLSVDGWTRLDVGARYRTRVSGKDVVLRANIENLLDEETWIMSGTYATVSAPRTFVLSAAIDF